MQRRLVIRCAAAAAAVFSGTHARAQSADIEEIVVTADFRATKAVDIPASVSVRATLFSVTNASRSRVVSAPSTNLMPPGKAMYSAYFASGSASRFQSSVA